MEQLRSRGGAAAPPKVDDAKSQHDVQKSTQFQGLQAPRDGGGGEEGMTREEGGGVTREALLEKLVRKDEENQVLRARLLDAEKAHEEEASAILEEAESARGELLTKLAAFDGHDREIATLRKTVADLEKDMERKDTDVLTLRTDVETARAEKARAEGVLDTLVADKGTLVADKDTLVADKARLQEALEQV